jgi:hypothetical protein
MAIKIATHILEVDKTKVRTPEEIRQAFVELIKKLPEHQLKNLHIAQVMVVH